MKSVARITLIALVVLLGLGTMPGTVQAQTPSTNPGVRTITVTGVGSAYTAPDIAYVSLGVNIADENLANAIKTADTKIAAVKTALKAAGVAETDIQTSQYSVYQEDTGPNNRPRYHVVNILRSTVRDISKVGDVLNKAVAAGANAVYSVDLSVKDTHATETTARKAAFDDAKSRATELSANMNGSLGQVLSISENIGGGALPPGARGLGGGGGGGGGGISSGSMEVTVSLVVTFEVK
jgi:uncharacterized protein